MGGFLKTLLKMVRILITDAFGIGYVAGHEYLVTKDEAVKLIGQGKAIAVTDGKPENAIEKKPKLEKRG